jgi:hypothetical protein
MNSFHSLFLSFLILIANQNLFAQNDKQKGVCWVAGREIVSEKEISELVNNGVTWISQTPFGWQRSPNLSDLNFQTSSDRIWWGESDEGISKTTTLAKAQGIKSILKPHLWVQNGWPGDVEMKSDTEWQKWFSNYEKFIFHYALLAQSNRIEILCIGTELQKTISHEKEWRALIKKIRSVYNGKLIYAANFHNEYEHIRFWDALDYIGIQAYFPLAKNQNASINELVNNWNKPLASIESIRNKYNKPVIFTEIGYRSDVDAAIEPWRWPGNNDKTPSSNEAQSKCYEAFFKAVWNKGWLAGAYFWKWYPHGPRRLAEIDFTPQGKPAVKIMAENFRKSK